MIIYLIAIQILFALAPQSGLKRRMKQPSQSAFVYQAVTTRKPELQPKPNLKPNPGLKLNLDSEKNAMKKYEVMRNSQRVESGIPTSLYQHLSTFSSENEVVIGVRFVNPALEYFITDKWKKLYEFKEGTDIIFKPLFVKEKTSNLSLAEGLVTTDYLSKKMWDTDHMISLKPHQPNQKMKVYFSSEEARTDYYSKLDSKAVQQGVMRQEMVFEKIRVTHPFLKDLVSKGRIKEMKIVYPEETDEEIAHKNEYSMVEEKYYLEKIKTQKTFSMKLNKAGDGKWFVSPESLQKVKSFPIQKVYKTEELADLVSKGTVIVLKQDSEKGELEIEYNLPFEVGFQYKCTAEKRGNPWERSYDVQVRLYEINGKEVWNRPIQPKTQKRAKNPEVMAYFGYDYPSQWMDLEVLKMQTVVKGKVEQTSLIVSDIDLFIIAHTQEEQDKKNRDPHKTHVEWKKGWGKASTDNIQVFRQLNRYLKEKGGLKEDIVTHGEEQAMPSLRRVQRRILFLTPERDYIVKNIWEMQEVGEFLSQKKGFSFQLGSCYQYSSEAQDKWMKYREEQEINRKQEEEKIKQSIQLTKPNELEKKSLPLKKDDLAVKETSKGAMKRVGGELEEINLPYLYGLKNSLKKGEELSSYQNGLILFLTGQISSTTKVKKNSPHREGLRRLMNKKGIKDTKLNQRLRTHSFSDLTSLKCQSILKRAKTRNIRALEENMPLSQDEYSSLLKRVKMEYNHEKFVKEVREQIKKEREKKEREAKEEKKKNANKSHVEVISRGVVLRETNQVKTKREQEKEKNEESKLLDETVWKKMKASDSDEYKRKARVSFNDTRLVLEYTKSEGAERPNGRELEKQPNWHIENNDFSYLQWPGNDTDEELTSEEQKIIQDLKDDIEKQNKNKSPGNDLVKSFLRYHGDSDESNNDKKIENKSEQKAVEGKGPQTAFESKVYREEIVVVDSEGHKEYVKEKFSKKLLSHQPESQPKSQSNNQSEKVVLSSQTTRLSSEKKVSNETQKVNESIHFPPINKRRSIVLSQSLDSAGFNMLRSDSTHSLDSYSFGSLGSDSTHSLDSYSFGSTHSLDSHSFDSSRSDSVHSLDSYNFGSLRSDSVQSLDAYTLGGLKSDSVQSVQSETLGSSRKKMRRKSVSDLPEDSYRFGGLKSDSVQSVQSETSESSRKKVRYKSVSDLTEWEKWQAKKQDQVVHLPKIPQNKQERDSRPYSSIKVAKDKQGKTRTYPPNRVTTQPGLNKKQLKDVANKENTYKTSSFQRTPIAPPPEPEIRPRSSVNRASRVVDRRQIQSSNANRRTNKLSTERPKRVDLEQVSSVSSKA